MKQETNYALFNLLLVIFIGVLIFLTVFLVRNVNEIKDNPISYGVKKYDFYSCRCQSRDNIQIHFDDIGVVKDTSVFQIDYLDN